MILVEVKPYCNNCLHFEADVENASQLFAGDAVYAVTDTIVRCKSRNRCESIVSYLLERG